MSSAVFSRKSVPIWVLLGLTALWIWVILRLAREWSLNESFHFGWAVPILILCLLHRRWEEGSKVETPDTKMRSWAFAGLLLLGAILLPLRVLSEANPAWRLVQWSLVLVACAMTVLVAYGFGGARFAARFGFPFLLMLAALPWPSHLEAPAVQSMTSANARLSVEALSLVGIPVVLQGENVLHLAQGNVRIDDACSGIRSLHLAIALGCFWGALYQIRWWWRGVLVAAAIAVALLANLARNLALGAVCYARGTGSMEFWHDVVGIAAQLVFLTALWGVVVVIERREQPGASGARPRPRVAAEPRVAFAMTFVLLGIAWLGAVEGLNEWWYWSRSKPVQASTDWNVAIPAGDGFQTRAISAQSKSILRPDEHCGFAWQNAELGVGLFSYLRWEPGSNAAQHAQVHRPEICLPASGLQSAGPPAEIAMRVAGQAFDFRGYEFADRGQPVFVFYGIWDDELNPTRSESAALAEDWSAASRLRAAWFGRRQPGQRVLEAAFWQAGDLETASGRFQSLLDEVIQVAGRDGGENSRALPDKTTKIARR
jgi:exosortase